MSRRGRKKRAGPLMSVQNVFGIGCRVYLTRDRQTLTGFYPRGTPCIYDGIRSRDSDGSGRRRTHAVVVQTEKGPVCLTGLLDADLTERLPNRGNDYVPEGCYIDENGTCHSNGDPLGPKACDLD